MRASNATGDSQSYALARDLCQKLQARDAKTTQPMADQVRHLLLSQPPGSITEEDVARALFVSKRTLARRLAREGSGYRTIRDSVLSQLADRYLRESNLTVEAVAELLGYHDAANFRRAFRRWYGVAPSIY